MTNLDSTVKSRDITLPTKVHIVKAMVFPIVMYGYERWTIYQSLGQEDPLKKRIATHSSLLVWRIPGREEPGRLQSMG